MMLFFFPVAVFVVICQICYASRLSWHISV